MSVTDPELAQGVEATEGERLAQAQAAVRAYCGWHIAPIREDDVVVVDGTGTQVLMLPTLQLVEVTALTVSGDAVVADDLADVQASRAGYLWRATCWPCELGAVEATITHGYAEVPPEVQAVVQALAARAMSNPGSLVRKQVGPFGETYSQTGFNQSLPLALLDAERAMLARYRIPSLA